jgi:hypothetical protein
MSNSRDLYQKAIEALNHGKAYAEWQREQERLAILRAIHATKARMAHDR